MRRDLKATWRVVPGLFYLYFHENTPLAPLIEINFNHKR